MSTTWQSPLLECGCTTEPDSCDVCLCGLCCSPCLYGKTVRGTEDGRAPSLCSPCDLDCDQCVSLFFINICTCGVLNGLVTCGSRAKLRARYALGPAPECCGSSFGPHCFCNSCAVVQDFLQLRAATRAKRRAEAAVASGGPSGDAPAQFPENNHASAPPRPQESMRRE